MLISINDLKNLIALLEADMNRFKRSHDEGYQAAVNGQPEKYKHIRGSTCKRDAAGNVIKLSGLEADHADAWIEGYKKAKNAGA